MIKNIYELKLHECTWVGAINSDVFYVTRVPGGWLYDSRNDVNSFAFVPYDNEFQEPDEVDDRTF